MRNRFDKELASLHDLLIEMGTLSQQAIESAKDALLEQDVEKAARTHEFEREVDEREKRWSAGASSCFCSSSRWPVICGSSPPL